MPALVVAATAGELIVAVAAVELVAAGAAVDHVVTVVTDEQIIEIEAAGDRVVAVASVDHDRHRRAAERIDEAEQRRADVDEIDDVGAVASGDLDPLDQGGLHLRQAAVDDAVDLDPDVGARVGGDGDVFAGGSRDDQAAVCPQGGGREQGPVFEPFDAGRGVAAEGSTTARDATSASAWGSSQGGSDRATPKELRIKQHRHRLLECQPVCEAAWELRADRRSAETRQG